MALNIEDFTFHCLFLPTLNLAFAEMQQKQHSSLIEQCSLKKKIQTELTRRDL